MYKSKLFSSLSTALLVAVLLAFTSAAQAAPKINPGGGNPGTTTTAYVTEPFFLFANVGSGCFNASDLCSYYYADGEVGGGGGGDWDVFASAYASASVACQAGAWAGAGGDVFVAGGGLLELNRRGKHGAMHNIYFEAGLSGASYMWTNVNASTAALTTSEAYASGGVSGFSAFCNSVTGTQGGGNIGDRVLETCALLNAYGFADGSGGSRAGSYANAFSGAGSASFFSMGGWTEVWASNIERFEAVVAAGADQFSNAYSGAQAEAYTEAYANAYMDVWEGMCSSASISPPDAFVQLCADGWAYAYAKAFAYADAFANAQAEAAAVTSFSAVIPVVYQNLSGTEDLIDVGLYGGNGAQINVATYCNVPQM